MNILINGLNSKVGGGKTILINILETLEKMQDNNKYYIILPNTLYEDSLLKTNNNIVFITLPKFMHKLIFVPLHYIVTIPILLRIYKIDKILNLGDIPVFTNKYQIFYFDWPHAIYPDSQVWKRIDFVSKVKEKIKLILFKTFLKYIDFFIVQTVTAKKRLSTYYDIRTDILVIPNAIPSICFSDKIYQAEVNKFHYESFKLLYLTYYYPHKNIEILIDVAKKIKENKKNIKIFVTISPTQHKNVAKFLKKIEDSNLEEYLINLGPIQYKNLPSLYQSVDGIIMPTLLESFSTSYLEAMCFGKLIFTSNLDFAIDVCGDAAIYFDPLNYNDIYNKVVDVYENEILKNTYIQKVKERIKIMKEWDEIILKIIQILR